MFMRNLRYNGYCSANVDISCFPGGLNFFTHHFIIKSCSFETCLPDYYLTRRMA